MAWGGERRPCAAKPADSTRTLPAPRRLSSRCNTAAANGLRKMLPLHSTSTHTGGRRAVSAASAARWRERCRSRSGMRRNRPSRSATHFRRLETRSVSAPDDPPPAPRRDRTRAGASPGVTSRSRNVITRLVRPRHCTWQRRSERSRRSNRSRRPRTTDPRPSAASRAAYRGSYHGRRLACGPRSPPESSLGSRRASSSPQGHASGRGGGFRSCRPHSGGGRDACSDGLRRAEKLPVPQLGRKNRDERLALAESLRTPRTAAPHQSCDRLWIEDPCAREARGLEQFLDVLRRPPVEERRHVRRAVWLLASAGDRRRDEAGPAPPPAQDVLLPQATQLAARGKRSSELKQPVVEIRDAGLHAVRHRHAIALRAEQIRREQRRDLKICGPGKQRPGSEPRRQRGAELGQRVEGPESSAKLGGVEVLDAGGELEPRQVRKQRIVGRADGREVAPPEGTLPRTGSDPRIQPIQQAREPARCRPLPAQQPDDCLLEEVIAEEHLVRPLPREYHLDTVLLDDPREQI